MTMARAFIVVIALAALSACSQGRIVLLDSGKPSAVTIRNDSGVTELTQPGQAVDVAGRSGTPKPIVLSQANIQQEWGDAIAYHPPAPVVSLIYFVLDTTELTAASRTELPKILSVIKQRPAPEVAVVGYTDRSGDTDYNYQLGLRRAEAVRSAIETIGVAHSAITVDSYGAANPLVETKAPYEPRNRRVEITVR